MDPEFRDVTFEQLVAHRSGLLQTSEDENSALWSSGTLSQQIPASPRTSFTGAHACSDLVDLRRHDEIVLVQALDLLGL